MIRRAEAKMPERGATPVRSSLFPLALAALIGLSPATLVLPFFFPGRLDYTLTNLSDASFPWQLAIYALASFLLVGSFYLYRWLRRGNRGFAGIVESARSSNSALLILLACPPLAALAAPAIEKEAPFFTLLLVTLVALIATTSVYGWSGAKRRFTTQPKGANGGRGVLLLVAVVAAAAAYSLAFSWFSILNHRYLNVASFDLAIYDNLVWNTSHGRFLASSLVRGGTHMSAHFDPLLTLLVPFYRLSPNAETLLIFQSTWLASASIPLFLLSRRILGVGWISLVFAGAFLLHPALHGINLYEFHSLALVVPLVVWSIYFLERGNWWGYWIVLSLILLTREDMALLSCGIGLYVADSLRRPKAGIATVFCALLYFSLVKLFVMAEPGVFMSGKGGSYGYRTHFEQLIPREGGGAIDFLLTLATNPMFALRVALEEAKLLYLLQILLPCLFIPLFARGRQILLAYGFVFCLLSSKIGPHSIHKQYSSVLLPFVMVLLPYGLRELTGSKRLAGIGFDGARLKRALAVGVAVAALLVSWKFGALVENRSFRVAHWRPPVHFKPAEKLVKEQARYEAIADLVARIPASASVSATRFMLPHVTNRKEVYIYPRGGNADYLLVRPGTLGERGRRGFHERRKSGDFEEIGRGEGVVLLKRVQPARTRKRGK
jgi:uncharacterized membrane protein